MQGWSDLRAVFVFHCCSLKEGTELVSGNCSSGENNYKSGKFSDPPGPITHCRVFLFSERKNGLTDDVLMENMIFAIGKYLCGIAVFFNE